MITVIKAKQVETIARQEFHLFQVIVEAVEIEQHLKDAVVQPMLFRRETLVHHIADIKARFDMGRRHYSAAANKESGAHGL
jgi:hypothetical protein